jgi:hypothetical protein
LSSSFTVIGCDTNFESKLLIGPFLNFGFTVSSSWQPAPQANAYLNAAALNNKEAMQDHADTMYTVAQLQCVIDFIEATDKVLNQGSNEFVFTEKERNERNQALRDVRNHIADRNIKGRREFARELIKMSLEALEDLLKEYGKAQESDIRFRAALQERMSLYYDGSHNNDERFDFSGMFRAAHPDGKDCSGPAGIYNALSIPVGPEWKTEVGRKFWEFAKLFSWHPTTVGNLFGAGLTTTLGRKVVTVDSTTAVTEFSVPLVGPFWVSGGEWFYEELDLALADFQVFKNFEYLYQ